MNIEYRSVEVRTVTEDRIISGIAVPYGQIAEIGGFKETFERGAFGDIADVKLFYGHNEPIGVVTRGEDTEEGFVIEARISETPRGNEVYTLLRDGVLNKFSVGFIPVEDRLDEDVVVRTKATLKEVSVVPFPAYDGADILAVRNNDSDNKNERGHINMSNEINYATVADLANVRDAVEDVERRMAVLGTDAGSDSTPQFRSAGELVKALADNDEGARTAIRAYTGATSADSHVGKDWKSDLLVIVDKGRPTLNLFNRGPLGPSGNTIEYPRVDVLSGDVASQANEGDDLAYLEVTITTASTPVLTYGGYSELTRQAIERSDVSYLDAVLRYQAASYAKVTNAKVRSTLTAATPQTGTSFTLASATAGDFLKAVVDGVAKIDANGQGAQAEFIVVSSDVALQAAVVLDTNGNQIFKNGIAGLPIVVDSGLPAKSFYVASSAAITSWENAGAPVRLEDENIINLSKQFSLYGYLAVAVTNSAGLVKAVVA